jgi:hypothetical protein
LEQCERVIRGALDQALKVAAALADVRDGKLYRRDYGTFEEYCQQRWHMTARYARNLMEYPHLLQDIKPPAVEWNGLDERPAADTEEKPRVTSAEAVPPPAERQVRPLKRLPKEERREAWQEAVRSAPNGKVRGEDVERVVSKRLGKETKPTQQELTEVTEAPSGAAKIQILLQQVMNEVGQLQALFEEAGDQQSLNDLKSLVCPFADMLRRYSKPGKAKSPSRTGAKGLTPAEQSKADKAKAEETVYVICREPLPGAMIKKARYAPGWGYDPKKAGHYNLVEAKVWKGTDTIVTLDKALKRFAKGL